MVTQITRATLAKTIMQNFLDLMNDNVVSTSFTNPSTGGTDTHTIKRTATTHSDTMLKEKSNYPLIIVYKPKLPEIPLTYRDIQIQGVITIEIHETNSLAMTQFYDQMKEVIITNKAALAGVGIKEITFTEDDNDTDIRSGFKDQWANFVVSFEYEYTDGY